MCVYGLSNIWWTVIIRWDQTMGALRTHRDPHLQFIMTFIRLYLKFSIFCVVKQRCVSVEEEISCVNTLTVHHQER